MLFLLFSFLVLSGHVMDAIPIVARGEPSPPPSDLDAGLKTRAMFSIIWGCLSTTFICVWVSVHPNVPPPTTEEYGWKSLVRRLRLMFWTLVVPELVLAWSVRQWYAAGKIANIYNNRNGTEQKTTATFLASVKDWLRGRIDVEKKESTVWTRTHGHFVAMGGFVFIHPAPSPSNHYTILNVKMLKELVKVPAFKIDITEEELEDRTKGDFLSKAVAILQVSWFVIQVIARFVQGLAVTELEVITLALASMNAVMFFFWWNKPLGVKLPVKICFKHQYIRAGHNSDGKSFGYSLATIREFFTGLLTEIGRILRGDGAEHPLLRWFILLPGALLLLIFSPLLAPLFLIFASLRDVIVTDNIPIHATHVPAFYSPQTENESFLSFIVILPVFGFIFGGLHCVGWNFTYPSQAERMIWRVASLTITLIPVISSLCVFLVTLIPKRSGKVRRMIEIFLIILTIGSGGVYVLARLALLVDALSLLRHQPTSALRAVDWTKFLPHL